MDLQKKSFTHEYAGKTLTLETSILAGQATSAFMGNYGNSSVLVTVVMSKDDTSSSYFPLQVVFQERFYAVGRVFGSRFMRREGRPSDESILAGRLLDRTIRPLFDHRMRRDVQIVVTVLSYDPADDIDFLTLMTTSAALSTSKIPWTGPAAGLTVAQKNGEYLLNPGNADPEEKYTFTSFVAGTKDRINMIELEGLEASEEAVLKGFEIAQKEIAGLVGFIEGIVEKIGKTKEEIALASLSQEDKKALVEFARPKLEKAIYIADKTERETATGAIGEEINEFLSSRGVDVEENNPAVHFAIEELVDEIVHTNILKSDKRPDLRGVEEIRPLQAHVGVLKQTHGSGIFIRGNTQALAVTTIAPPGQEQLVETMLRSDKDRFLLHYNFPSYSVGETGPFRGPGRREVGHGALAKKAIRNMLPEKGEFPYMIRVVSEILSSNGSSSMATVCATVLSLMDAGVPLKKPVAGIAMGLVTSQSGEYKVLTDIQGYEDHYGDADCKVAGTKDGITAMQMDVKIGGLTIAMLKDELTQSKKARLQILEVMTGVLSEPRKELSPLAPSILTLKIKPEQIGLVIGSGGKTINGIIEKTGCLSIDIDDDGTVYIASDDQESGKAALAEVARLTKEYAVGDLVDGTVVKLLEFGAIVEFDGDNDGMIHVSEISNDYVKDIKTVIKVGDHVRAKVVKAENGKIGLSLKGVSQQ